MRTSFLVRLKRVLARPWLVAFVPINAATSAFGVVLPLYILLNLHGRLLDVGVSASLFSGAVVFASILWGALSDRYAARRAFLVINFAGFAGLYLVMAEVPSLPVLFGAYAALGVLAPAGASASNLLILEQFSEEERATAYASFQEMSILGGVAGGLVGFAWLVTGHGLVDLLIVLAVLALASVPLIFVGKLRPAPRAYTLSVARHAESLSSRLRHHAGAHFVIPFFPRRPPLSPGPLRRFTHWAREEVHHELPLIFAAALLFNLSANLFNTSYTPYLLSVGVLSSTIFLVNLTNNGVQAVAFPVSGFLSQREGVDRLVAQSTYARSLSYLTVLGFTIIPLFGTGAFQANLLAYSLAGASIAFYSTASSLILFRGLQGRDAPNLLGVNSALGGIAAITGAFLSGILSEFGGYRLTFALAAATLLVSLPLWSAAQVAYAKRRASTAAEPERGGTQSTGPAKIR
jgi:MFS family permease